MDELVARTLVELAEEPGLWLPPEPAQTIVRTEGFSLVTRGRSAAVHHIRLAAGGVAGAVEAVRHQLDGGFAEVVWWVGEHSTPQDVGAELERLGLEPADPPALRTFGITGRPHGEPTVEVRRVSSLAEFLQALEIDWEAFGVAEQERTRRRETAVETWPLLLADGTSTTYLASLDDEPVGFARAVFTPSAAILVGGATLPHARGKGVYSSTVLARWEEAVERGVPRIAVSAGPLSAPVLERLGFVRLGSVQLLRDRL
jgi:hypothetical protein